MRAAWHVTAALMFFGLLAFTSLSCQRSTPRPKRDCSDTDEGQRTNTICMDMACDASVVLSREVNVEFQRLLGARLEVCYTNSCLMGVSPDSHEPPTSRVGFGFGTRSYGDKTDGAEAFIEARPSGGLMLEVRWFAANSRVLCIGDEFRVVLHDAHGSVLAKWDHEVSAHRTTLINGPGCPPACRTATLIPSSARTPANR